MIGESQYLHASTFLWLVACDHLDRTFDGPAGLRCIVRLRCFRYRTNNFADQRLVGHYKYSGVILTTSSRVSVFG